MDFIEPDLETILQEQESSAPKTTPVSYETGGLVKSDTPIPEDQGSPRFISSTFYYEKYRHLFPDSFTNRDMAPACRKWHEDEELPENKRIGLISEKRLVRDMATISKVTGKQVTVDRKRWQWFIFDIPPQEHPGWTAYHAVIIRGLKKSGSYVNKHFKELAPVYLERFDNARKELDHTQYRIGELAQMLHTNRNVIKSWTEIGIKGFGKLPHIKATDAIRPMNLEDGTYTTYAAAGRVDYYYATKDIRRFLKGELAEPKKFKTIDDITEKTNLKDIAIESGFYMYDPTKVYPLSFQGFIEWARKNIVFYDRKTRQLSPFNPSPKQIEFYKEVFSLKEDGSLKYTFGYACRPRGDYKTFDIAVVVLFRFFNLYQERMYLVTNSVQQTTHLVYREAYELIKRSPTLSKMLNIPALDIQKEGIYLRSGRGLENIVCSIEIISAEGGARSNATCIVWSEAWKYKGAETDVAEIMQSIRGVDNALFLAESTVAPKGHWFERQYQISINDPDPISYFQYYDGSQRQNPKIDQKFLESAKKSFPFHYKMFFDNKWEDAALGLFSEGRIIEMGALGIDGGKSRNVEMLGIIKEIVDLNAEIKKYQSGIDVSQLVLQRNGLLKRLTPIDYRIPAPIGTIDLLSGYFNCDFIIGIGLDRAKHLQDRSDRTVLATIARAIFTEEQTKLWGTDRMFFLLNLHVSTELSFDGVMRSIQNDMDNYGGGFGYIDLEDYNVVDIYKTCEKIYGQDVALIAPNSYKHQIKIFTELHLASEGGYLKIPEMDIYVDDEGNVHFEKIPIGIIDIIRSELAAFESSPPKGRTHDNLPPRGRGSGGYFGSIYKEKTGRTKGGEPKDDCIYAIAHAVNASLRGDIPAVIRNNLSFASAVINKDNIGDYSDTLIGH